MIDFKHYFSGLLVTIMIGCITPLQDKKKDNTMRKPKNELSQKIINNVFGEYFYYPVYDNTLDNLWNSQGNIPDKFQEIIRDDDEYILSRLIACEVLYKQDLLYLHAAGVDNVAQIYCKALEKDITQLANSWGLLYDHDDAGPLGTNLLMTETFANRYLIPLLQNEELRINYDGSEEATFGNDYQYRVKDFAAYYLHKINNIPIHFHRDHGMRDAEIAKFKIKLEEYLSGNAKSTDKK